MLGAPVWGPHAPRARSSPGDTGRSSMTRLPAALRRLVLESQRQGDGERRAAPHFGLDLDGAPVTLHDAEAHRQPEPGAADLRLRREERIEDPVTVLGGDAGAGVREGDPDPAVRRLG